MNLKNDMNDETKMHFLNMWNSSVKVIFKKTKI